MFLVVLTVTLVLVLAPIAIFRPSVGNYAIGILAGVPSGFLLSFLTWWWQTPSLTVDVADSKYDGVSDGYWVHLKVKNRAWGFLGGGTAQDCRAKVRFDDGREFVTKWKNRPNPRRPLVVPASEGKNALVEFADASLYDQARTQSIRPREDEWLDVAFRPKWTGGGSCYVAVPENFRDSRIMLFTECELKVGRHPFSVTLQFLGGESGPFKFVLVNQGGPELDSSSLRIEPGAS
jgi:hypothetical protein